MDCKEYERYFFRISEWELLLAGLGVKKWYGLDGEESEEKMDKHAYHSVLAGLYQKNVIDWVENGVRIKVPFSKIFEELKNSRRCITIDRKNDEFPIQCCYIGTKGVVVTEKSQREINTLCVSYMVKETFTQFILEYLSEYSEGISMISETGLYVDEQEKFTLKLQDCRSGERIAKLTLYENGLQTYLTVENEKGTVRIPYRRSRCKDYLNEWL